VTFIPNPNIDAIRAAYRLKYDEILKKIHECDDLTEKRKLQQKEQRLNNRTKRFLAKHSYYYTSKRKYHVGQMVNAGTLEYDA
jgi:hypothetical protein